MTDSFTVSLPNTGTVEIPVRFSARCSRILLRAKGEGLELVLPFRCRVPEEDVRSFLRRSVFWMERTLARSKASRKRETKECSVPETITLPFTGKTYTLNVLPPTPVSWAGTREEKEGVLTVSGCTGSTDEVLLSLRRWLIRKAEAILLPHASELASEYGYSVAEFRTGIQKRTWGKCTSKRVITLNAALLFVPQDLVRYVIFHEFTHLEEMNHSERFWRKLEQLFPGAHEARKRLNNRNVHYVPAWVYGGKA